MRTWVRVGVSVAAGAMLAGCFGSSGDVALPDTPPVTDPFKNTGTAMSVLPPGQSDGLAIVGLALEPGQESVYINDVVDFLQSGEEEPDEELQAGLDNLDLASLAFTDDQVDLYWSMTQAAPGLNASALGQYFKDAPMLAPDAVAWLEEIDIAQGPFDVTVRIEPEYGVPHIYGADRDSAFFGLGYATARDRLFLMDVLRRAGRGELSRFMGRADFSFDQDINRSAPYTEAERTAQFTSLPDRFGALGERILADGEAFLEGVNYYVSQVRNGELDIPLEYVALNIPLEEFVLADGVAVATVIQAELGSGGGGEPRNVELVQALMDEFGDVDVACDMYHDIRHANMPGTSVSTRESFPTQSPNTLDDTVCPLRADFATRFPGAAIPDQGSYESWQPFNAEPCGRDGQPACPGQAPSLIDVPNTEILPLLLDLVALLDIDAGGVLSAPLGTRAEGGVELLQPQYAVLLDDEQDAEADALAQVREAVITRVKATLGSLHGWRDRFPETASNALLVNAEHTASQNPIAVFGPQVDYFAPQLLMEAAMYAPSDNVAVRGVTFPGLPYVIMGRGVDFAWSPTSSGVDMVDIRVLELCDDPRITTPGSYVHQEGGCVEFERLEDEWTAAWNLALLDTIGTEEEGQDYIAERRVIRSPHYGPVVGFATVGGQPVALARQRTTYMREADATPPFALAVDNSIHDAESFHDAFSKMASAFTWFYADSRDTAMIAGSLYPDRPDSYYPDFPSLGNGAHDWQGFLEKERMPKDINPEHGYIANWNNQIAADWWPADRQHWGSVDRNNILEVRLDALVNAGGVTVEQVVEAMSDAAYVDLRAQELLPRVMEIIDDAADADQQQALDLLSEWAIDRPLETRAQRRDRSGDGVYDDTAAVALMDAWYDHMIDATLPQMTSPAVEARAHTGRDNKPGSRGSAYNSGWYSHLGRVFDMALGDVEGPFRQLRCADSDAFEDCRNALLSSLDLAIADLGGIGEINNWTANQAADEVTFEAIGLDSLPNQHWINRPTFQQVIQFNSQR